MIETGGALFGLGDALCADVFFPTALELSFGCAVIASCFATRPAMVLAQREAEPLAAKGIDGVQVIAVASADDCGVLAACLRSACGVLEA